MASFGIISVKEMEDELKQRPDEVRQLEAVGRHRYALVVNRMVEKSIVEKLQEYVFKKGSLVDIYFEESIIGNDRTKILKWNSELSDHTNNYHKDSTLLFGLKTDYAKEKGYLLIYSLSINEALFYEPKLWLQVSEPELQYYYPAWPM
jgi:hypothetical protein